MQTFKLIEGSSPLLISLPHCGTQVPVEVERDLTDEALLLADTDWHVEKLYGFASELGASVIRPYFSRYVIDLNRPPDNADLYPGANSTALCPITTFAEHPIYLRCQEPSSTEVARRLKLYWQPYHQQLQKTLAQLKERHGVAILFEAHSICSEVPRLFDGRLPDLNVGTSDGRSCAVSMLSAVNSVLANQLSYTSVINQRFKGGYITRAYGLPDQGIHALQLELAQCTYMQEAPPFRYLPDKAACVQPLLRQLIEALIDWAQLFGSVEREQPE